ncbi:MAG: hypothetical protein IJO11_03590 [Alphaproteobacteria bacterium]|nr:hypothetical protein [Alphaproteobacteria bacterium]
MPNYYTDVLDVFRAADIYYKRYTALNKDWLMLKYFHTLQVVKVGEELMQSEPIFHQLSDKDKQRVSLALLMHDIGRAFELREDGSKIEGFQHGAAGMQWLIDTYQLNDIAILSAVLVHDQTDMDFLDLSEKDLCLHPRFQKLSDTLQNSVLTVNQQYHSLSNKDKQFVKNVCYLVKDADTLSNILDYTFIIPYRNKPKIPVISDKVFNRAIQREYVLFSDIQTFADTAVSYMAWFWKFTYNATIQWALKENVPEKIKEYVLSEIKNDIANITPQIQEQIQKTADCFDELIKQIRNYHTI